jgi:D-alanyl-D-alanine endopeptidase (penicillin-binding protein 7)
MKIFMFFILLCWSALALAADPPAQAADQPKADAAYVPAAVIRSNARRVSLELRSHVALVYDERDGEIIMERNAQDVMPIASLTKLVTAMVVLDGAQSLDDVITISAADRDRIRYSRSRLSEGMQFTRRDLLLITLAASENRAAFALARTWPGGFEAFVEAMNHKAAALGLSDTRFADPAGLSNDNVSTAHDLLAIVKAASDYPEIGDFSTQTRDSIIDLHDEEAVSFGNTNRLVHRDTWPISLSKTGFTRDAGNCMVMQTEINNRPVIIVLLESWGKLSRYGDSNRIRTWLLRTERLSAQGQVAGL